MSEPELYQILSDKFDKFEKIFRFGVWVTSSLVGLAIIGAVWVSKQEATDTEQWKIIESHSSQIDKRGEWVQETSDRLSRIEERQVMMLEAVNEIKQEVKRK